MVSGHVADKAMYKTKCSQLLPTCPLIVYDDVKLIYCNINASLLSTCYVLGAWDAYDARDAWFITDGCFAMILCTHFYLSFVHAVHLLTTWHPKQSFIVMSKSFIEWAGVSYRFLCGFLGCSDDQMVPDWTLKYAHVVFSWDCRLKPWPVKSRRSRKHITIILIMCVILCYTSKQLFFHSVRKNKIHVFWTKGWKPKQVQTDTNNQIFLSVYWYIWLAYTESVLVYGT